MLVTQRVAAAARTHLGRVRRVNQDSFGSDEELGLYVVCDGMGGAAGGEVASSIACDTFLAIARQELLSLRADSRESSAECTRCALTRAVSAANRAVLEHATLNPSLRGMGSTLVAARLVGEDLTIINVGDSRAYLFPATGVAAQLTQDHSWVAEQVGLGLMTAAQAQRSSLQSVITRAIGIEADVRPDLFEACLQTGDTFLLTSDGLTRHVTASEMTSILAGAASIEAACSHLIETANARGGSDNITCILARLITL